MLSSHRSSPHLLAYSIARPSREAHSGTSHDPNSAIQRTQVESIDDLRLETRTSVYRASEIIDDDVQVIRWARFWSRRIPTIDMGGKVQGIVALGARRRVVWLIIICLIDVTYRYSFVLRYVKMVFTINFVN